MIHRLLRVGVYPNLTRHEKYSVVLLNGISLILSCIFFLFLILNILHQMYNLLILNILFLILLSLPIFALHYFHKYKIAPLYFLCTLYIHFIIGNLIVYHEGRFSNTEHYFLIFIFISLFLLDGYRQLIFYFLGGITFFIFIALKFQYLGQPLNLLFYYTIVNNVLVLGSIYGLTVFFKQQLARSEKTQANLNSELNVQNEEIKMQNEQLYEKQELLIANRQILRSLIDNMPLFMALLDKDGKYVVVNKQYEIFFNIHQSDRRCTLHKNPYRRNY